MALRSSHSASFDVKAFAVSYLYSTHVFSFADRQFYEDWVCTALFVINVGLIPILSPTVCYII